MQDEVILQDQVESKLDNVETLVLRVTVDYSNKLLLGDLSWAEAMPIITAQLNKYQETGKGKFSLEIEKEKKF